MKFLELINPNQKKIIDSRNAKSFEEELLNIRLSVVSFLLNLFILISTFALLVYIWSLVINLQGFNAGKASIFVVIIFYTAVFLLIKKNLNGKNYRLIVRIILVLFSLIILISAVVTGTYSTIIFPIFISGVLTTSIVLSFRSAQIYTIIMFVLIMVIAVLHNSNVLSYQPETTTSDFSNTLVGFFYIGVVLQIAHIGYFQIGHSYTKALKYSRELEKMNKELDLKVKERTKLLKDNFDRQIESMYTNAVVGNITRPLLHDLSTPISALEGVIEIANKEKGYDKELYEAADNSLNQIKTLIAESKELMRGKDVNSTFDLTERINKLVNLLINEFRSNDIDISVSGPSGIMVEGVVSLFERIVINIINNAVEELKNKKTDRRIRIEVAENGNLARVEINDNGRGVPSEFFEKIFQDDFSLKNSYFNLGLGLSFVKNTVENKFKGSIRIDSELGKYTKFIIELPKLNGSQKKNKQKS